jgi:hypothetical protein
MDYTVEDKIGKEIRGKGLGQLMYFFRIEAARGAEIIVLSQRKYVLNLFSETSMLGASL